MADLHEAFARNIPKKDQSMLPSIKKLRPDLYDKLCKMQVDMVSAGGRFDAHGETFSELADWTEDLVKVQAAALALTEECKGGDLPPALGTLAKLESALHVEWTARNTAKGPAGDRGQVGWMGGEHDR